MNKIFITLIILVFVFINNIKAQSEPEEIITIFFNIFERNIDKSIDYLFSTNEYIDGSHKSAYQLKERLDISRKLLGDYYGYEIIKEYKAGESYRKYLYLIKYDRQPIKIEFILYKANDIWKVQNVTFHDDVSVDFDEVLFKKEHFDSIN